MAFASVRVARFVHSPDFSRFLATRASVALKSDAKLAPLQWRGSSAASESLLLIGGTATAFERLEASALRANWNWRSLLEGIWKIENVEIENLSATFRPMADSSPGAPVPDDGGKPPTSWLPSKFELGRCDVRRADLRFGEIQGSGHTLAFEPVEAGCDIEARGGSVSIPGLPALTLAQGLIRVRNGTFHLDDSRFFLPESGSVSASGYSGPNARLNIIWDGVPVADIPFSGLANHLDGTCRGQATLDAKGAWRGNIRFTNPRLHDLPLLKNTAALLGDSSWKNPQIQKLDADFEWSAGNLTLTNLVVESTGLARIEGGVRIATGGALAGQLQVGLDQNALKFLPGARETVFNTARNGWHWASVQLGGTLSNPSEDLSSRLATSIAAAILLKESGKAIDTVPSSAIDTAKDILNIFAPLLP